MSWRDYQIEIKSGREDSNLRPPAPEAGALAGLRYAPFCLHNIIPQTYYLCQIFFNSNALSALKIAVSSRLSVIGEDGYRLSAEEGFNLSKSSSLLTADC